MNETRLQAPMLLIGPLLFLYMLLAGAPEALGQEIERRPDTSERGEQARRELLSRLASGDEEQRIDSAVRISALLQDEPGVVETSVITSLCAALQQDSSPLVRALAARALEIYAGNQTGNQAGNRGGTQGDEAGAALLAALGKERDLAARKAIIYALARYAQPQVTSALIPFLKNKSSELRAAAAYALAESGDPASARALAELLKRGGNDDAFARSQAARGLGRIGGRDSIDLLIDALSDDGSQEVRRDAAISLGRIVTPQDAKAVEALRKATLSNDPYLVSAAENAIASINSRNP
ncbi:MAG TPA: HEAT repeat domain-containing protein [Blastocatellia bacterium]|jgi:HEAT repeat protein|nr:HEAT repeat domain-containing protein [Blastocatellia bacterium]